MATSNSPLPFTGQQLQQQYEQMRAKAKNRFLNASFPRKLFEGPLNSGRFDIEYLPRQNEFKIYLKVFFNFVASTVADDQIAAPIKGDDPTWYRKTWQATEMQDWKTAFKNSSEAVWNSANVQFRCTRPGWEDITCVPRLTIEEAGSAALAHYEVKVEKTVLKQLNKPFPTALGAKSHVGAGYTRVKGRKEEFLEGSNKEVKKADVVKLEGRANVGQNYDPTTKVHVATPVANLNQMDTVQRVGSTSCGGHLNAIAVENFSAAAADFDYNQVVRALSETGAGTLRFDKHGASVQEASANSLKAFAARLNLIGNNPSSEALSKNIVLELKVFTDKNESYSLINKRKSAVEQLLHLYGVKNPVRLKSSSAYMPHKDRPEHGIQVKTWATKWVDAVELSVQDRSEVEKTYSATYKYMTVPHEVGHMLGLLDEYAPTQDELLIKLMAETGVIAKANAEAAVCARDKDADRMWARLLQQFDLVAPAHAVKVDQKKVGWSPDRQSEAQYQAATTSLMSAGFNVAPQHFVIIGLGLQEYTESYTTWDMERQFAQSTDPSGPSEPTSYKTKKGFVPTAFASTKRKFMWRVERI
jgi:hypothetical protein